MTEVQEQYDIEGNVLDWSPLGDASEDEDSQGTLAPGHRAGPDSHILMDEFGFLEEYSILVHPNGSWDIAAVSRGESELLASGDSGGHDSALYFLQSLQGRQYPTPVNNKEAKAAHAGGAPLKNSW